MNRLAMEVVAILGLSFLGASCIIALGGQAAATRPSAQTVAQAAPTVAVKPTQAPAPPTNTPIVETEPLPGSAQATAAAPTAAAPAPTLGLAQAVRATAQAAPKPTAKPEVAQIAVGFTGKFDPITLRVGQKLVVALTLENKSDQPIEGLRIFSTGPWDKYTIVNVMPNGRYEKGLLGHNFYTGLVFPPGVSRTLNIIANPNEPGNHEFTFIPHQDTRALKDEKGEGIVIGGKVNVTR